MKEKSFKIIIEDKNMRTETVNMSDVEVVGALEMVQRSLVLRFLRGTASQKNNKDEKK